MRVLIDTPVFWPSVGGIEAVTENLARGLIDLGHEVTVVTKTESTLLADFPYPVIRRPSFSQQLDLVKEHDIVFSNGTSALFFPWAFLLRKPFVWTHATYRFLLQSGLPPLKRLSESLKLFLRKKIAALVDRNIAISMHMAKAQPLPRQIVIPNPVDTETFERARLSGDPLNSCRFSFAYLGRLVTDKGVDSLLRAFADLIAENRDPKISLALIGDGPEKENLINLARNLQIEKQLYFLGKKTGAELIEALKDCAIFVVPSLWEEPFGLVAIELMAAGRPLIVSERGGLLESAGTACLSFPNGDAGALVEQMKKMLADSTLRTRFIQDGYCRAAEFSLPRVAALYESLFLECIAARKSGAKP
ncbi:MAG: glycosyltransferase family 4 protein [Candidatus Obscuribacterales bacterium]|nr:glycosyltransferase family 4 protein [Candidatus Obscuribacterales bacterium]